MASSYAIAAGDTFFVFKIFAADVAHLIRSSQVNACLCARFWGSHKWYSDPVKKICHPVLGLLAQLRAHHAGVQAVYGDRSVGCSFCQLVGKHDIAEFRKAISLYGSVVIFRLQVTQIKDACAHPVDFRGDIDNATLFGFLQMVEQQIRQQKWGQMVYGKCFFNAVNGFFPVAGNNAGVVNQYVNLLKLLNNLISSLPYIVLHS